ncbi:MAG TPA: acetolactate synthase small subunit [Candidatus Syntrophoarchaeum butanivorans]|uniref:Acetolactate synthase small subunit n=1 Tax=Candidatus Syntropharchaeum butanivorans TaxID=1839936 RepID=A0A7C1B3G3_9EURY|nr:MAG: acetolactate synthase small subunit [Candidatus Syntrophoarchaeum sp. WYZ-LMO15]HDM36119.1 acetolactate synthase small subunit [Candidatus Syntrophoarchaeum butanivorans]HEC56624.1 acetolactate synthase small subunit [Candidatus Syntrophoarchaeum butanivorans]
MKHTLTVLVENKPGVAARVTGLFTRRGFNIDSINAAITDKPDISRLTIVITSEREGGERQLEQITKQLNKLIDVIKISDITAYDSIERELVLVKVDAKPERRTEILQIVEVFRAKIVDIASESMIIEVTGDEDKISAMLTMLADFGIREVARTGKVAMIRGAKTL